MTTATALLFSQMQPRPGETGLFDEWYETDHIPARMAIPGFLAASRYRALEGEPRYLAVYELESLAVLDHPAYRLVKEQPSELTRRMLGSVTGFTRYTGVLEAEFGAIGALAPSHLSVVAFDVPPQDRSELHDFYRLEHAPLLLDAPDWLRIRRFRVLDGAGGNWTDLLLHDLGSAEVMHSPQRERARSAPRRNALAARPWFAASGRWLYERFSVHLSRP